MTESAFDVPCFRIGSGDAADIQGRFEARYAVGENGAVLVRPDGFVACRFAGDEDAEARLRVALDELAINISPSPAEK